MPRVSAEHEAAIGTARDLAMWLLRPYVQRGDEIRWVRRSGMGFSGQVGWVHVDYDHVYVTRLRGAQVCVRFSLAALWQELQAEHRGAQAAPAPEQLRLFPGEED